MNILITRLQNIGDMLVFIPALRFLRETMPEAKITLLCKHNGGIEIIKDCPYYDDMIIVRNRSLREKLRLIKEFRKRKLDCFIISPQDLGRCPWGYMGGAKKIIGFKEVLYRGRWKKEKLPFLLTCSPEWDVEASETENCANLVSAAVACLGMEIPEKMSLSTEYSWIKPETPPKVKSLLDEFIASPYIVAAPFSKQANKNWPFEQLAVFLKELQLECGMNLILVGGPDDSENCDELCKVIGKNCISAAGELSLDQSAWLISGAKLFFGPDSGPAHLATAVKTPAVVLYGPADYKRWRTAEPAAPRIDLLGPDSDVNNITEEDAMKACLSLLEK